MMRKINKYSLATADICLGMGILFLWPCVYSSAFCINPGILHKHTDASMAYKFQYMCRHRHRHASQTAIYSQNAKSKIPEIDIQNFAQDFAQSGAWGTHPILLRNAFKTEAKQLLDLHENVDTDMDTDTDADTDIEKLSEDEDIDMACWPDWGDVMELASDEDAESRLITHIPDDETSWELEMGPLEIDPAHTDTDTDAHIGGECDENRKWTVVVNDVDRFVPSLSEWIGDNFAMIPQWRRDDGQISLSNQGGGIGAHVDDYDVFLIQMSGRRQWDVGNRVISTKEEVEGLIPLDVRILNFWDKEVEEGLVQSFVLEPGDALYLPPRFGHRGTALTDKCMTLSVGLRAPSAKEMMTKMMDHISDATEGNALKRYTDQKLFHSHDFKGRGERSINELNSEVKLKGKRLVREAINEMLDDDDLFDKFFGQLVTESKRMRFDYPLALNDLDDECRKELGVWGDAKTAVDAAINGLGVLYASEGLAWAYSHLREDNKCKCRVFIDGNIIEVILEGKDTDDAINMISKVIDDRKVTKDTLCSDPPEAIKSLLEQLVDNGYLYGSDEK